MVAEFNGKLNRIQVKTANEENNGSIKCYCRSSKNHTTNKEIKTYENDIDYFVFYNQIRDIIALVPIKDIGEHQTISLRLEPTVSGQVKGIRFFKDYSFDKILP